MKRLISIIFFSSLAVIAMAQPTVKQVFNKGLEEYYSGNYIGAAQYLNQTIERGETSNQEVWYFLAKSTQRHYAYKASEQAYHYLIDSLKTEEYNDASYELAQIKQTLGKYEEASRYYDLYLSEYDGEDNATTEKARMGKQSCDWAVAQQAIPKSISDDSIFIENLGSDVNTAYSEHAGIMQDGNLYFSSLRFPQKNRPDWYQEVISKVLVYDTASTVMEESKYFNNGDHLTSSTAFSDDGSLMIYTICEYGKDDANISCDLYWRKKLEDGTWNQENKLPQPINIDSSTSTHPAFGASANGKTTLYFVSNRDGGSGGMDIYKTAFNNEMQWEEPENIKSVNTAGDDVTPFFNEATSTLFFSTNGRVGMGGMDIFKSAYKSGIYTDIENLGHKVNTAQEDIYFTTNGDESLGYFSSNRFGSMFLEDKFETCCFDIYKVEFKPCEVDLLALLYDEDTKLELDGVTLILRDLDDGSVEEVTITNDDGNDFTFLVDCDKEYEITASRDGYEPATITLRTGDGSEPLEEKIYLKRKKVELEVAIFERATKDPLGGAEVTVMDVETGEILEAKTLDGHITTYDVIPGKEYKIISRKPGYDDEELSFIIDDKETEKVRKEIYMGRKAEVKEIAKLIPLKLYFDNDEPERKTLSQTTNQTFTQTYDKYYEKRQEFEDTYAKKFSASEQETARMRVQTFFETEVKDGHKNLQIFMEALDRTLQKGLVINLYLRGYASPLASDEYNYAIGQRRVQSIRNEFARYNNGVLSQYLNSGQLSIKQRSFGEETAPDNVNDSANNPRLSIFSPEASAERRIELEEISQEDNQ